MNFSLQTLLKTPFQKHIATLFSGTVLAQAINVLGALLLAKLYAPERYGTYSSFLSFVSILTVFNSLKLEYIIITEKSLERGKNIGDALVFIILLMSVVSMGIFGLTKEFFSDRGILFLVLVGSSVTSFFLSNSKVLESLATRTSAFKTIATARVLTAILVVSIQFLLFYYTPYGLLYGYGIAMILLFIFYAVRLKSRFKLPHIAQFKTTLKAHKNIVRYAYPSGLVNVVAINGMPILLLAYFSAVDAGVYALSLKVVSVPLFIISSSVSQVYFQKASSYFNTEKAKIYSLTLRVARSNFIIMLVILGILNTLGIYLLELVLDDSWKNVRSYMLCLSFLVLGQVSFSPISSLIVIINKMHLGLMFNVYLVAVNLVAVYIGYQAEDIFYTISILSIASGLGYMLLLLYFLNHLKKRKNA